MDDVLVLARLGLAGVFLVAGAAKLLDQGGTRQALGDFAAPDRLVGALVVLLPAVELATAAALLFPGTVRFGAVSALVLLSVFVVVLTQALRRGETPDCHCFGQVHSEPTSWETVARNVVLAVPAAYLALAGPGPSLLSWANRQDSQQVWLLVSSSVAVVATLTSLALWRANRRLRKARATAPQPLRIGARAPGFSLPSADGGVVRLRDLLVDGRPCVLTFVAPGCGPCATVLPEIARWREALADRIALPVVSAGDPDEAAKLAREYGLGQVLSDPGSTVSRAYGVPGTPCGLLVAADGTVKSAPAPGQFAIEALVRLAVRGASSETAVLAGVA